MDLAIYMSESVVVDILEEEEKKSIQIFMGHDGGVFCEQLFNILVGVSPFIICFWPLSSFCFLLLVRGNSTT